MGYAERLRKLRDRVSTVPRVTVMSPSGEGVKTVFHRSMLRLHEYESSKPERRRLLSRMGGVNGLYIAKNRQEISHRFMDEKAPKAEWLLQIDTDIEFPESLLESLVGWSVDGDLDVLAASVPLEPFATCGFMRSGRATFNEVHSVSMRPQQRDAVATACILIRRRVLEGIADRHGRCWFHHIYLPKIEGAAELPPEGHWRDVRYEEVGEDTSFSVRAVEAGFKLWVVHIPGMGHHKTKRLSHDDERTATVLAAEEDLGVGELVMED